MNSSVDRHLGCFHVLVIVNKAAINIRVHEPFQIIIFPDKCPRVRLLKLTVIILYFQFSSVALCNPMDCSTPGLPVHHRLLEFTQTHVH